MARGLLALALGLMSATAVFGAPGDCVDVQRIYGKKLFGSAESVKVEHGKETSRRNRNAHVSMGTRKNGGEFQFKFEAPCEANHDPRGLTLELSARVNQGTGASWSVDIMNQSIEDNGWQTMGDLSLAPTGEGWTDMTLTVTDCDITDYLDASSEILVRMTSPNKWQAAYIDFAEFTVSE